MKVGIYSRWLSTLGGGEKYMLALAECLAREHAVEVITHQAVDLQAAAAKLNVNTRHLRLRCLPEMPGESLASFSAEYDLFVSASQFSLSPSQARQSILLVFFPWPLHLSRSAQVRREVGLWLRRKLLVPVYARGFYGAEHVGDRQARWTDGYAILKVPVAHGKTHLSLWIGSPGAYAPGPVTFKLNGQPIARIDVPESGSYVPFQMDLRAAESEIATIEVISQAKDEPFGPDDSRPVGVAISDVQIHHWRYRLYHLLFERFFKEWGLRLLSIPDRLTIEAINTYPLICAISHFTRQWIQRYWGRESEILYPPVDVETFQPSEKRNIILTVGRVFAGGHNKKHLPMIDTFRRLVDGGLQDWEFHIAGSVAPEPVHQDYYRRVVAAAQGYPIHVHPDIPLAELQGLYGAARIYWHASGYGEDEQREPIKFEHFGITTVEAMAAGAVPVVIGKAGQLEVVEHERSGLHWQTLDELAAHTLRLISDQMLWSRLSEGARERSRAFGRNAFDQRINQIMGALAMMSE